MQIKVNIEKRHAFIIIGLLVVLIGAIFVMAATFEDWNPKGTGYATSIGHDSSNINYILQIAKANCTHANGVTACWVPCSSGYTAVAGSCYTSASNIPFVYFGISKATNSWYCSTGGNSVSLIESTTLCLKTGNPTSYS